jgi:hypothetical protein
MTRNDTNDATDPPGGSKAKSTSARDRPLAELIAGAPSRNAAANEFDPREAFFPKALLHAEDRPKSPAAKAIAAASYIPDPQPERGSPLRFLAGIILLAVLAGGAYWYSLQDRSTPPAAASTPNARSGAVEPAPVQAPATAPPIAAVPGPTNAAPPTQAAAQAAVQPARTRPAPATGAHAPGAASGVTHTKVGAEPAPSSEPARTSVAVPSAPAAPAPPATKSCAPQVAALGLCSP